MSGKGLLVHPHIDAPQFDFAKLRSALAVKVLHVLLVGSLLVALGAACSWRVMSSVAGGQREQNADVDSSSPLSDVPSAEQQVAGLLAAAERSWVEGDYARVILALDEADKVLPNQPQVLERLFAAHGTLGIKLAAEGRFEDALAHLDAALRLRPDHAAVKQARQMVEDYTSGQAALARKDLPTAISHLEEIYALDRGYHEVTGLLYQAYYQQGLALREAELLAQAKSEFLRAVEIAPSEPLGQQQLREVTDLLTPPTPTPSPTPTSSPTPTAIPTATATPAPAKKIVVSISQQRLRAYENGVLKWNWVCSSGRYGSGTRLGEFAVQSKFPNAWGGTWSIWMPYWLGIYWAGGTENGIHALPINPDGSTLWSGYLGTPISFGCIVLDTWAAKMLYDWADIGTPVIIQQ
jgi:lipoprotein-anchoring transpeptidase ErfK/SrfK